jgi:hypothetical protein
MKSSGATHQLLLVNSDRLSSAAYMEQQKMAVSISSSSWPISTQISSSFTAIVKRDWALLSLDYLWVGHSFSSRHFQPLLCLGSPALMHFRLLTKYVSRTEQRANAMTVVLRHVRSSLMNLKFLAWMPTGWRPGNGGRRGARFLRVG